LFGDQLVSHAMEPRRQWARNFNMLRMQRRKSREQNRATPATGGGWEI
jgi:hypothetical protein